MNEHPFREIAEESPEAMALVGQLLDHSAREREWVENAVREGLERERDQWRARALRAEEHLA